jgi:hypothetical protein
VEHLKGEDDKSKRYLLLNGLVKFHLIRKEFHEETLNREDLNLHKSSSMEKLLHNSQRLKNR